jgi:DNA-binding Xre family transcriptional regulator
MTLIKKISYFILASYMTLKKSTKKTRKYYRDEAFLFKVGGRIKELMTDKGITHEVFYNDTSINPHRLIIGKMNMTLSTFARICEYLETTPEDFFKAIR